MNAEVKQTRAGWLFLLPALALIGVFFVGPVIAGLVLSFTDFDLYAIGDPANALRRSSSVSLRKSPCSSKRTALVRSALSACAFPCTSSVSSRASTRCASRFSGETAASRPISSIVSIGRNVNILIIRTTSASLVFSQNR